MQRRTFIKSSILMGLGSSAHSLNAKAAESVNVGLKENSGSDVKPHIIFIMTDQHRGDELGCMGNKAVISPNLDNLAKEGTIFLN